MGDDEISLDLGKVEVNLWSGYSRGEDFTLAVKELERIQMSLSAPRSWKFFK